MATLTFSNTWAVNGVLTNVTSMTLGIFNNTTQTQVVAAGTAMTNVSTGTYQYVYSGAVTGNLYTATYVTTYGGTQYTTQSLNTVAGSAPATNTPITSSSSAVAMLQQQLADIYAQKEMAISSISTVLLAGLGPSYTITGRAGSETVSMTQFLDYLRNLVQTYVDVEKMILQMLQDLQPFTQIVTHQVGDGFRGHWSSGSAW